MRKLESLHQKKTLESELKEVQKSILQNVFIDFLQCLEYSRDLDEMLSSLGVAPVSEVLSSLSSVNSATSDHSANQTPDASLQHVNGT